MATTQKRKATGAPRKKRPEAKQPPAAQPVRRELWGLICLLLAVFAAFGYFKIDALFVDWFGKLLKGLFGYGFWFVPPVLLFTSIILIFHRGRPVARRVVSALLLIPLFGGILQLFLMHGEFDLALKSIGALWKSGLALKCGGVISGYLTLLLVKLFSKVGTGIILILVAVFALLSACDRTPLDLIRLLQNRPKRTPYEPVEVPEPQIRRAEPVREPKSRRKLYDIPMEDGAAAEQQSEPAPEPIPAKPEKKKLFNATPNVKRPDEILSERKAAESVPASVNPSPADSVSAEPIPVVQPTVEQAEPAGAVEVTREPAVPKHSAPQMDREEAAQVARQVAADIDQSLEQEPEAYRFPPVTLLKQAGAGSIDASAELSSNRRRLDETIRSFGIEAKIVGAVRGPSVTRYEAELEQGVRLNKLTNLADDIALALGTTGVRIAPVPDKISVVGIEVPNKAVSPVTIREVLESSAFTGSKSRVAFALGKDIANNHIVGDISKLPHLLIAGTTGSGKSVCTNSIIISLLYKSKPEDVRMIMVDPKMVELGIYNGIPHLLIPVVTDPKKAAGALQWAVAEMMKRYRSFSEANVRELTAYNAYAERTEGVEKMPHMVVLVDELADLMMVAAKEVEEAICRLAQMGRAAGIHLVIATQRPSADVITGLMKANIPSRIAFAVASAMESRIILDTQGAEKLVGKGDMLWFPLGAGKPLRVQGCFISEEEVASVVEYIKQDSAASYDESVIHEIDRAVAEKEKSAKGVGGTAPVSNADDYDELLPDAINVVIETGMASVSMLQRRLKLGYSRAARLVDQMEEKGVVGPFEGSKPRQVLITKEQWEEMQFRNDMTVQSAGLSQEPEPEYVPDEID